MSYILDALRRAQNEREAQPLAPHSASAQEQRLPRLREPRTLLMALAGAGAVAVIVLIWVLWPAQPTPTDVAPPAPQPTPATAAAPVTPEPEASPVTSMDDLTASDVNAPIEGMDVEVAPLMPENLAEAPESPPAAADPAAESAETDAAEESPRTSSRTVQLDPAPTSPVKTLRDMPDDYRAAFPPLKIEVHVYDDNPASRFVMLEGRRYHEGEALPQGPQLSEIRPDGVIFSFRGAEVLVPVGY